MVRWGTLGALACFVGSCGARTGLDVEIFATDGTASSGGGGSFAAPETTGNETGPFCAFKVGPVPSCNAPASDGPFQRCDSLFPHCIEIDGQWSCCSSPSNNNGAGGSCRFLAFDPCE